MKKNLFIIAIAFLFISTNSFSLSLIHYWNFNGVDLPVNGGTKGALVDVVLHPFSTISEDITSPTTSGSIVYQIQALSPAPTTYSTFWEKIITGGSTLNARTTLTENPAVGGNYLKLGSPTDKMQLVLTIPSQGYQGIAISYDVQNSGSGPTTNTYAYSVDNGVNWITATGLSAYTNSTSSSLWQTLSINITDINADNNLNLLFKITLTGANTTSTSGNNRFDNITVEGTPVVATSIANTSSESKNIKMYTNGEHRSEVVFSEVVDVVLYDLRGRKVKAIIHTSTLQTDELEKGVYLVAINGAITKKLIVE